METGWKRSLVGYDGATLGAYIKELEKSFRDEEEAARKKLVEDIHQLDSLKYKIAEVQKELDEYETMKGEIAQALFDAHYKAALEIDRALRDIKKKEKDMVDLVARRKAEIEVLNIQEKELIKEMRTIMARHESIINKGRVTGR